ncbi:MAG: hypothetical protein SV966_02085 [Actinomycetota bacterium]|nr:hypothetical protein [Actinomycetota bacterium]
MDVLTIDPGDMYSDDGAGSTVFGPDGSQPKVDLSIRRPNDIRRTPASQFAAECVDPGTFRPAWTSRPAYT